MCLTAYQPLIANLMPKIWFISKYFLLSKLFRFFVVPFQSFLKNYSFLFDYDNYSFAQLYGIKYSYPILL